MSVTAIVVSGPHLGRTFRIDGLLPELVVPRLDSAVRMFMRNGSVDPDVLSVSTVTYVPVSVSSDGRTAFYGLPEAAAEDAV